MARIIVNGDEVLVPTGWEPTLTYEEVVSLAGMRGNPSVAYANTRPDGSRKIGTMCAGCTPIEWEDGMSFTVSHTGGS